MFSDRIVTPQLPAFPEAHLNEAHVGEIEGAWLLVIAIVGTTVAPWQLFFQQSNVIDKRITPRWLNYERIDTIVGAFVVTTAAAGLMTVTACGFARTPYTGHFADAGTLPMPPMPPMPPVSSATHDRCHRWRRFPSRYGPWLARSAC